MLQNRQILVRMKDGVGADSQQFLDIPFGGSLEFDGQGQPRARRLLTTRTTFNLLAATSVAAGTDPFGTVAGTGTEVIATSAKGGMNLKTQATTPADGDNVLYGAVANTGFHLLINSVTEIGFRARVAIGSTAFATMFASFGLNENITDVDPTGTAGEGALFLYDPTQEVTTGLTLAQHANWILAHKVNGVDTFTATNIPVVAGQDYELEIRIGTDLKATYYINGVSQGQGPTLTTGDSIKVFIGAELTATPDGQADFDTRYLEASRNIG